MVVASRYFAFRALITQRTGIDFVSCLHNCREFSQTSLEFISGYANTENVFYCIIIWLCGGTLCGYFCWSGWPRAYSELNPTPHLTPKYLLPTQWVSSPSPTYSLPLRPVRVPVHTPPWHTNYAICDAQLRHRNRATPTPKCVNGSPILYGFFTGACAKAIRYGVNTYPICFSTLRDRRGAAFAPL